MKNEYENGGVKTTDIVFFQSSGQSYLGYKIFQRNNKGKWKNLSDYCVFLCNINKNDCKIFNIRDIFIRKAFKYGPFADFLEQDL